MSFSATHRRFIVREITKSPLRTIFVCMTIGIGVFGIVCLTTLGQLLTSQLNEDLKPENMAMLRIHLHLPDEEIDYPAIFERLRSVPYVEHVEAQSAFQITWQLTDEDVEHEPQEADIFSFSQPFEEIQLEGVTLVKGRYPDEDQAEVAIEQRFAANENISIGDTIQLYGTVESLPVEVVGIVHAPYMYIGADPEESLYTHHALNQRLLGMSAFTSVSIRFQTMSRAREYSQEARSLIEDDSPLEIHFYLLEDPTENIFIRGTERFSRTLIVFSISLMTLASLLVTNIIYMTIVENFAAIGAIKTLGATRFDIIQLFLSIAFIYGVVGTIPGVIFGNIIGQELAQRAAPAANTFLPQTSPQLIAIMIGIGMGLMIPTLAALPPCLMAANVSIRSALEKRGIRVDYGKGLLTRFIARLSLPLSLSQALNNVLRNWRRLTPTILTLLLAITIFVGSFSVVFSLFSVLDKLESRVSRVSPIETESKEVFDAVQSLLLAERDIVRTIESGVAIDVELVAINRDMSSLSEEDENGDLSDHTIAVAAIDPEKDAPLLQLQTDDNPWDTSASQEKIVVLTDALLERYQLEVGDEIQLASVNNVETFQIVARSDYPLALAFMETNELKQFIGEIPDAPTPNSFWELLRVQSQEQNNDEIIEVWTIGINEELGQRFSEDFTSEDDGVLINTQLAAAAGLEAGDRLVVRVDESVILLQEDEIAAYTVLQVINIDETELNAVSRDIPQAVLENPNRPMMAIYWAELAEVVNLDYSEGIPQTYVINFAEPPDELVALDSTPNMVHNNGFEVTDRIGQTIVGIAVILALVVSLIAIIGATGLFTTIMINLLSRQLEIGILRSVGASSGSIMKLFLLEGFLVGIIAWVLALPLGYYFGLFLTSLVPFRELINYQFPIFAPLLSLAGVSLLTFISSIYPAWLATRRTVSEILRY